MTQHNTKTFRSLTGPGPKQPQMLLRKHFFCFCMFSLHFLLFVTVTLQHVMDIILNIAPWAGRDLARSRLSPLSAAAGLAELFRDDHCLPPMLGSVAGLGGLNTSPSAGNSTAEQRRNQKSFSELVRVSCGINASLNV